VIEKRRIEAPFDEKSGVEVFSRKISVLNRSPLERILNALVEVFRRFFNV